MQAQIDMLLALAAQGAEAIAVALRTKQITIHTGRPAKAAKATTPKAPGTVKRSNHLTLDDARIIRQRRAAGESREDLACEFGTTPRTIWAIDHNMRFVEPVA